MGVSVRTPGWSRDDVDAARAERPCAYCEHLVAADDGFIELDRGGAGRRAGEFEGP
jgi:hypothetical protein